MNGKRKKLQIITSLAIINSFASPLWGNEHSDVQNNVQIIPTAEFQEQNTQNVAKNKVVIRSKHLAKYNHNSSTTSSSTTHTSN